MEKYIYVGADWCPKCRFMQPKFEKYCKENNLQYEIIDLDKDENSEVVDKYNIRNIPIVVKVTDDNSELIQVDKILK